MDLKKLLKKASRLHVPYIILLILLAFFSHTQWFNINSTISWGDWYYFPEVLVGKLIYLWNPWINFFDLGYPNIQINYFFFMSAWSFLSHLGFTYNFSSQVTFFMPISILSFLSPYILSYKLSKNKLISFIVAIFY